MKHIKKKFMFQDQLKHHNFFNNEIYDEIDLDILKKDMNNILQINKESKVIIETEKNEKLMAYIHLNDGKYSLMPLPDFTLVYYNYAYNLNTVRKRLKKEIFKKLADISKVTEAASIHIYEFYGTSTSCIILLFTSLESFVNSILLKDKDYIRINPKSTEYINYEQIQKGINFTEKVSKVLPQFYNKSFFKHYETHYNKIMNFKDLRDRIVHTKSDDTGNIHSLLFKDILNYDYDSIMISIRIFMNFYNDDYIVDCPCSKDF